MKERIKYIDFSKAVAIIMVVTGHIIFFNIFNQSSEKADALLIEQVLKSVQMPLFVFCSGLVVKNEGISLRKTFADLYKRFRLLIIPFMVIGISYALVIDKTPALFLSKGMKLGYWYLLVLFELYMLHYIFIHVSQRWTKYRASMLYDLLFGGGIFIVVCKLYSGIKTDDLCWQNTLSVLQLIRYYPYFFLAVIMRKYNMIDCFVSNKWVYSTALCMSIVILYANVHDIHIYGRSIVLPVVLLVTIMHMMKLLAQSNMQKVKRILEYVGKNTLDIYLFHYFVLTSFQVPYVSSILEKNNGIVISLLVIIPIVIVTIVFSLALGKILRSSKVINDYIFYR